VDLKLISGSNYRVNNTFADEWLKYSINVPADATYDVTFRVSSKGSNGQFHLDIPDAGTLGPVHLGSFTIPNTGSNDTWTTVTKRVFLSTGQYSLRLYMDANSTYGSVGNFDWIRLTPVSVTPPPPTGDTTTLTNSIAAYVRDGASATTNFGNDAQLIVKLSNTTGNKREGYLKFDVSSLPSDPSAITNVKLRLNGKLSASGASPIVGVFGASNTSWGETAITWNTKPATSGSALATKTISGTTAAWYEWDITSYVKTARQNGQQFVTLVLRATNATDP